MGFKEATILKAKIPHLHPGVALRVNTQWVQAKVVKVMKVHNLLLQIEAEPMSKMLAANKATKIANR